MNSESSKTTFDINCVKSHICSFRMCTLYVTHLLNMHSCSQIETLKPLLRYRLYYDRKPFRDFHHECLLWWEFCDFCNLGKDSFRVICHKIHNFSSLQGDVCMSSTKKSGLPQIILSNNSNCLCAWPQTTIIAMSEIWLRFSLATWYRACLRLYMTLTTYG